MHRARLRLAGTDGLIAPLACRATDLALQRLADVNPATDNEDLVDAIQSALTLDERTLIGWASDPSFGTLSDHDGSSRAGIEMLHTAANWLLWSLARAAIEVVQAMRARDAARNRRARWRAARRHQPHLVAAEAPTATRAECPVLAQARRAVRGT